MSMMRSIVCAALHGVQRREHQVAGLGGGDRGGGGLQVAHFADQDDVRVLTQHVLAGRWRSWARRAPSSRCSIRHLLLT